MNTGTAGRTVGRPEPDEIPSPWVGYVKRVPELDPVMACAAQIEETANLLRIARGDTTPLPGFDENAYVPVGKFDDRSLADLVGELRTSRAATLALLRTFDAEAWLRRGTANGKPVSVRALAYVIPGHERHHVEILRTRYRVGGVGGVC